jgi:dTDP-4-dehydrorhamnose reductase
MTQQYLVLGANGMVGRAWTRVLQHKGLPFRALTRAECDITNPSHVAAIEPGTDIVVNCAAYTQVDQAESDTDAARRANGEAVGALGRRCNQIGARLVHYSTDYVFDGRGTAPYPTDAPTAPVNAYGASKLLGEELLAQSGARALLIRTSWVYAPQGQNFVLTMANLLATKPQLRVVNDQRGRPTSADELAHNSQRLCDQVDSGTFHLSDGGECTWFEFACEIKNQLGLSTPVQPCGSDEYPRPAARPAYSVLDISGSERLLGPLRPWPEALTRVLARRAELARSS